MLQGKGHLFDVFIGYHSRTITVINVKYMMKANQHGSDGIIHSQAHLTGPKQVGCGAGLQLEMKMLSTQISSLLLLLLHRLIVLHYCLLKIHNS